MNRKKVLVVEDNENNRMLIKNVLTFHGYEVIEAINGEEGLSAALAHLPDIILMDLQMPVMNGMHALKALRENKDTRHIKVLAVTSFAMKGDSQKALDAGFDGYISKPIDTRSLSATINAFLS